MSGDGDDASSFRFADDGTIPNNPDLPLLLYRQAAGAGGDLASRLEELFAAHGWTGSWRDGIYGYHHYHSTAHEVLGVAGGEAVVRFGGERGRTLDVAAGDVVVIPAGVGHKRERASPDFLVVGAYAGGRDWDLRTGKAGERPGVLANIAAVPLPDQDPVGGTDGPLTRLWLVTP